MWFPGRSYLNTGPFGFREHPIIHGLREERQLTFERLFNPKEVVTCEWVAISCYSEFNIGSAVLYFTCLSATLDCILDIPGMPANLSVIKD